MTKTLISICIATYNRAGFIGRTLESIIAQLTDQVEIVVADGASTDNTSDVVKKYAQKNNQINYVLLPQKGGVDQDYCKAVQYAKGEYIWLMSDDDILKPGAIQTVLDKIKFNYSLIIVNAEVRNTDLSKVIDQRRLRISNDKIYASHELEKFFIETGDFLTFIGCVVINKSLWDEREKEKYFGSSFIHVGLIFQKPFPANILVIAEPYISIRYGNAEWSPRAFEIWLFKWPQLIWSLPNLPDEAKKRVTPKEAYLHYLRIMLYRAKGGYSINEYRKYIEPKLKSKRDKFILQLIARTPGVLVNFAGLIYYSLISTETGLGLIDMRNSKFYYKNYFKNIFAGK